jgi:phosphonate transport system substrate-binding protein
LGPATNAFLRNPQAIDFNTGKEDLMITRRTMMAGTALLAFSASAASAQEWKTKYPEITFAVIPAENGSGVTERFTPFVNYLSKELGIKVTLRVANDYAAVIEGQRAGNIHIGYYGPASFARARLTGVKTDAFVIDVNSDGSKGYYSVFYVLAKSPYQKLEDLKGKNLGLVDPNSTSGNNMPRFKMDQMGVDPEKFFSQVVFTGSHENAVLALVQGTVDVAANWWNADDDSNLTRMLNKNMVKSSDGTLLKKEDFRIIVKSDLIINSPYAYLNDLPDDMKAAIKKAFLEAAQKDGEAYKKLSDGKNQPWQTITNDDYNKTIDLIKFVDSLRKKAS